MQNQWFRLDTAALIFPAIMRRNWCNVFRISVTLKEEVDPVILKQAAESLSDRFPTFYVRLSKGLFWYSLRSANRMPWIREDFAYPLTHMGRREMASCCLRIFYYRNRIAAEFFHVISDGTGGSLYVQTLLEKYLELKHGVYTEKCDRAVDWDEVPKEDELEDSFFKNSPGFGAGRKEENSYKLHGSIEKNHFRRLICGTIQADKLKEAAKKHHCTITAYLAAIMAQSIIGMQQEERDIKHQKSVKITLPVNLRRFFGSRTLRNFALALNVGVDPRFGEYSLQDLCDSISYQLSAKATPQYLAGMIGANVLPQQNIFLRLTPVGLKNLVMGMVYSAEEKKGSINISNLGLVHLPTSVSDFVDSMDFIIGPQRSYPNNCSVVTCNGKTRINMISLITETELERRFFSALVEDGVPVEIESNL